MRRPGRPRREILLDNSDRSVINLALEFLNRMIDKIDEQKKYC